MRRFWGWIKSKFKKRRTYAPIKPIKVDGRVLSIEVHGLVNFSKEEKEFFLKAMKIKTAVLGSMEFQTRFRKLNCTETNGQSMTDIYRGVLTGRDLYNRHEDYDIDIFLSLYGHEAIRSSTVGYTYGNTYKIWTHRYHFSRWMKHYDNYGLHLGLASLAGHLFHEYLHNYGLDHQFKKSTTVPYKGGYLMTELCLEVIRGKVLTPIEFTPESIM